MKWIAAVTAVNANRIPTATEPLISNQFFRSGGWTGCFAIGDWLRFVSDGGGATHFASAAAGADVFPFAGLAAAAATGAADMVDGGTGPAVAGVALGFAEPG